MVASFPRKALIGISLVALASIIVFSQMATGVTGSSPTKQNVPTKPPFKVDHAGRPIPESLPDSVGIVGPDGKISRHISRQELMQLLGPPQGPPGAVTPPRAVGPKSDLTTTIEEKADGRKITTTKDSKKGTVTRTEVSADGTSTVLVTAE